MHAPVLTAVGRPPRVHADLAVHLTGHHDAQAVTLAGSILLVMPAARIRLTHPQPALAAYNAWCEATRLAVDLLPAELEASVSWPDAAVSGHVALTEPITSATVDALAAEASSTGTAQIRVQLSGLLVIAGDRAAVRCQHTLWSTVYRHAAELWPELPAPADLGDQPHVHSCRLQTAARSQTGNPAAVRPDLDPIPPSLVRHTP